MFYTETVRFGSSGPYVEALQLALTRAGYDPGPIDGIFGARTQTALASFQRVNGLEPDGIAGTLSWNALTPYLKGYTVHRVQRGDTFFTLARRYNTSIQAILTANPSLTPRNLQVGQSVVVPFGFPLVPTNISYTSELVELIISGLAARYPFIRVGTAGYSLLGRPITTIAIGSGATEVFYNASHHANEWITTPLLLKFAEDYSNAYSTGGRIGGENASALYGRTTLYMIPLVNPDGVDLVTGGISRTSAVYLSARRLSENYPRIPFPEGWKANIRGTDLNLNYPAMWERAREIKFAQGFTMPGPRDFVGPSVLSEPESRAVYDFTRSRNFSLIIAYHTQGKTIYWKFDDFLPPNSYEIARLFSEVSGYSVEETPFESGFAGYKDWFILAYNRPGYTIEAGLGANPLPISQFGEIYRDNLGILVLGMSVV